MIFFGGLGGPFWGSRTGRTGRTGRRSSEAFGVLGLVGLVGRVGGPLRGVGFSDWSD